MADDDSPPLTRDIAPFGVRMPAELKARVQAAAEQSNKSLNSLIVSVLEEVFPAPTIDLNNLSAFLASLSSAEPEDLAYIEQINEKLAQVKHPWTLKVSWDGRIIFYPMKWQPGDSVTVD